MNSKRRFDETAQVRWLWAAAFAVLIFGSGAWLRPQERRIASVRAQAEGFSRQDAANRRTIARIAVLQREQRRAETELRRSWMSAPRARLVAQFVRAVDREARALRLDIIDVEPMTSQGPEDSRIAELPVTVRLRGHFREMVWFLQSIARNRLPIHVGGTDLVRTNAIDAGEPDLEATMRLAPFTLHAGDLFSGGLNDDQGP